MKATILAGAVGALLWGAAAMAADCPKTTAGSHTQSSVSSPERSMDPTAKADPGMAAGTEDDGFFDDKGQAGVGGSGSVSGSEDADLGISGDAQMGVGGSGNVGTSSDISAGAQTAECPPPASGVGGSGASAVDPSQMDTQAQDSTSSSSSVTQTPVVPAQPEAAASGSSYTGGAFDTAAAEPKEKNKESKADMRGLTVAAGAGVEGYSFALAPSINPGPAWNVSANLRPTKVLGLEFGYSGAVNELSDDSDGVDGADIVRNGGQAVATLGLGAAPVQPYILGGIGISRYNVRTGSDAAFRDDTTGSVPVGAGLRTHLGNFTADARFGYNFLFDQEFARAPTSDIGAPGDSTFSDAGRYQGTLSLGTTF